MCTKGLGAADVLFETIMEDLGLWYEAVREAMAAGYGIPVGKLEHYYAMRNLLKTNITGQDLAEAGLVPCHRWRRAGSVSAVSI
jgi:hypothetical protein